MFIDFPVFAYYRHNRWCFSLFTAAKTGSAKYTSTFFRIFFRKYIVYSKNKHYLCTHKDGPIAQLVRAPDS